MTNSSISSRIGVAVADPVQRVGAGQFDVARPRDVLGEVAAVADADERGVLAVHDQRRRGDGGQLVPHVGIGERLARPPGHARRGRPVARGVPPGAEGLVVGDRRRDHGEHVDAPLHGVGFHRDRRERAGAAGLGARLVVGRPQHAGGPVDHHQVGHALGAVGGQEERAHRGESRAR